LLISSLLVSACFATTYPSSTYTANCTSPQLHLSAVPAVACSAAAACTTGFSDNAPASATTNSAGTATAAADCKYCAVSYVWDSALYANCILKAGTAGVCATGYSDNAPTGSTNAAPTAANSALAGNCVYCAPTYFFNMPSTLTGATCVLKTDTTLGKCATGYTDSSTGAAASATGSLTGNCAYCLTGTSDVAPTGTTNAAATAAGAVGACKYCAPNYYWNELSSVTGAACVLKTDTTAGKCAAGYADASTGTASAAGSLAGNCAYCATGYSDVAPTGTTNAAATAAGAVAACKYCAPGYTQTAVGTACTAVASTSSSFLMVSISVMATLIMIFF